jgi:hypothetical protein
VALLAYMGYLAARVLALQSRRPLPDLIASFDAAPSPRGALRVPPSRLVRLVDLLMRATFHDRYCMKRSLLLFHFLRRWGHDARIHFGVAKRGGELTGHAWVDLDGRPFAEHGDPNRHFTRTYSFPEVTGA